MTKATLTFTLPEDFDEFLAAIHGVDYRGALLMIDSYLRHIEKYENLTLVSIDEVRKRIREETEGLPVW